MQPNSEKIKALEALGRQLEDAGWHAPAPVAEAFEVGGPKDQKRRITTALAYLKINDSKIRAAVCNGRLVRAEITAAGATAAAVADSLQSIGGFAVPVWSISNTLCQLGLAKYCDRSTGVAAAVAKDK